MTELRNVKNHIIKMVDTCDTREENNFHIFTNLGIDGNETEKIFFKVIHYLLRNSSCK